MKIIKKYTVYYTVDRGKWEYTENKKYAQIKMKMNIEPDKNCPTKISRGYGNWEMKSGYGIEQEISNKLFTNDRKNTTTIQNAYSTFPEFHYLERGGYYRLLEVIKDKLVFKVNRFSTFKNNTHFTPIWYPDRMDYPISTYVFDAWTPAGQLTEIGEDEIRIDGNLWDDWHIGPLENDK